MPSKKNNNHADGDGVSRFCLQLSDICKIENM